jgi:hypothetical protein
MEGKMGPMSRALHRYNYQIHVVTPDTHDIIKTEAELNNWMAAYAAFNALVGERTMSTIQLREGGRIVWTARTGLYDSATGKVEELERF